MTAQGHCAPEMEPVRAAFQRNLDEGLEVGASVAVTVDGELAADLWGGHADEDRQVPWAEDTITNCWSTTKLIATLCMLILSDQADVGLFSPVSRYWPEFAGGGKKDIEIRHVLGHTSGVAGWNRRLRVADLYDRPRMVSLLEDQEPWWIPGTVSGYHSLSGGFILGEVIRRVTGQTMGEFFRSVVAEPLAVDFHIGLPAEHDGRVSPVLWPRPPEVDPEGWSPSFAFAARANPPLTGTEPWDPLWRRAEIPGANGQGNARSLAKAHAILACGGQLGERKFFPAATAGAVLEEQASGRDMVLIQPLRWGIGAMLPMQAAPVWAGPRSCYGGGWGGSLVLVDLDQRMSFAYMMNKMEAKGATGEDPRVRRLLVALHAAMAAVAGKTPARSG